MQGRTFIINSEFASSGSTSDFTFEIQCDNDVEWTHCCVLGCNIPISYYLVQAPYNTFTLTENSTSVIISIPAGNYNVTSFQDVLTTLLNSNSPNTWNYTMSFNNDFSTQATGLYTFNCAQGNPIISFTDNVSELHSQFGFGHNSVNTFISNTLTSTNVVNFIPEPVLTISSNICDDGNLLTVFANNTVPYSNITFQSPGTDLYSKRLANKAKDGVYHFSLLSGRTGAILNLNGLPMLINLLIYRPHDYPHDVSNYIKYKLLKE